MWRVSGIRKRQDKGHLPEVVVFICGFFLGLFIIAIIAIHECWNGGQVRLYDPSLYLLYGMLGGWILLGMFSLFEWYFVSVD